MAGNLYARIAAGYQARTGATATLLTSAPTAASKSATAAKKPQ